jgi:hypothetical protein
MTTATTGAWITDPNAYRRKLAELLGDRDPMTVMSETADILAGIVARHTPGQLRTRPFEGKWTPNEVIGHLTDSEWTYGYRMRLILSEDEPAIIGTDQDRWVTAQRFNEREAAELVEMFRSLRELNLAAWKNVTPGEMTRKAITTSAAKNRWRRCFGCWRATTSRISTRSIVISRRSSAAEAASRCWRRRRRDGARWPLAPFGGRVFWLSCSLAVVPLALSAFWRSRTLALSALCFITSAIRDASRETPCTIVDDPA